VRNDLTVAITGQLRKIRAFEREPSLGNFSHMPRVAEKGPIIELCYHLIRAEQFENAFGVYYHHLTGFLYHQKGAYQIVIELLEAFLLHNESPSSALESNRQSWLLDALAHAYSASGDPQHAVDLLKASIRLDRECGDTASLVTSLWNLGVQLQVLGRLAEAEQSLQECIRICHGMHDHFDKAKAHQYFALLRALQGLFKESSQHISAALSFFKELGARAPAGAAWAYQALCLLLAGETDAAFTAAERARSLADEQRYERDIIRAEWLLGLVLIRSASQETEQGRDMLQEAEMQLSDALDRCRRIDMVDYEADLLLACAHLHHAKGERQLAKEHATEALVIANRSDFRMLRSDISDVLARLAWEDGNPTAAHDFARAALQDALCDGPPYCYKPALAEAKHLLQTINELPS
jgi:tetratricopeptide (TPR) repeat protein